MTVTQLNSHIVATLSRVMDPREAKAAARIIWDDVLHYTPEQIITRGDHELEPFTVNSIENLLGKVLEGEPLQYAVGTARFMGMDFKVTPATLIPRPETAGLVDLVTDDFGSRSDLRVLDAGTGSGCIAIALSRALKFATVDAFDLSDPALKIAAENARNLGVKVDFRHGDILALVPPETPVYDIIVSNPPYVLVSEADEMERHVIDYEPKTALFVPDSDPLKFYRPLSAYARTALRPGGKLYFEINPIEADSIGRMLHSDGFTDVAILPDFLGQKRYAVASK